ncbi:MAG: formylglycine-generating enzyme family protein [Pseudomonadota bacterium]|nr:formylglycine-generating enzyme family protein [Pseudomonadota bacterium]
MKIPVLLLAGVTGIATATASQTPDPVRIPAGPFQMGCSTGDKACGDDEGAPGGTTVDVPAFRIDRYEVTVDEYTRCIDSGACNRPKDHARNKYCNVGSPDRGGHPVNCVDWQQALDYCATRQGRLPTEAEWEKAARAGSTSPYPWGGEVSCKQAILDDGHTMGSVPDEPDGCGEDRTWPIGSREANAFGLRDMHGNAGEWVMNWYAPDALTRLYAKGDLVGPENGRQRVVRGGSWDENTDNLRSSYRNVKPPFSGDSIYGSIGFRCADGP